MDSQPHHYPPPGMMLPPNPYPTHLFNNQKDSNFINPTSIQQPFPFDSFDHDVDGGFRAAGYNVEPEKKKRGRPRKYSDGNIAIGSGSVNVGGGGGNLETFDDGIGGTCAKKGRPAGPVKRQLDALGVPGVGFTPHVILVEEGEDIASKVVSFSKEGPRGICILSANGAVSNVSLQQSATPGDTITYEGRFEIISLSGSFVHSESDGNHSKPNGLSVSVARSDGRVLGGGVSGVLVAASPVQVIVGSFIVDGKKSKSRIGPSPVAPPNSVGGAGRGLSPQSDGPSSDSSDESGRSPVHMIPGSYRSATQHQQPQQTSMHNLLMYSNMGWPSSSNNMLPTANAKFH